MSVTTVALMTASIVSMLGSSFEAVPIQTASVPLSTMVCVKKGGDEAVVLMIKITGLKNYISIESMDSGKWPNGKIVMRSSIAEIREDKKNNASKIFAKSVIDGHKYDLRILSRNSSSFDGVVLSVAENGKMHELGCAAVPPPQIDPSL